MTGFRIHRVLNGTTWRPVPVDDFQLEHRPRGTQIVAICGDTGTTLRLQYHDGIVEYDHRQTAESLDAFYKSAWMGETFEQVCDKARRVSQIQDGSVRAQLLDGIAVKTSLDVGAGYGDQLANLRERSQTVRVIEPCDVRAKALAEVYGVETLHGSFPDVRCDADLIVCHHVIEHVQDAERVFAAFAECQPMGGRLVITCPNFIGEPSMGVCLFWPHQRSFTRAGLAAMAGRHGYTCELDLSHGGDLAMRFVRSDVVSISADVPVELPISKLRRGLCLGGRRCLGWERDYDGAAQFRQEFAETQQKHGGVGRCIEIDDIAERKTDCPIEIQWEGPTQVFVK